MSYDTELENLRQWLNNPQRSFEDGLQLYIAYVNNYEVILSLKYNRSETRLYTLLRDRVMMLKEQITIPAAATGNNPQPAAAIINTVPVKTVTLHKANQQPDSLTDISKNNIINKLEADWKQLRAQQGVLHTTMVNIGMDDKGKPREILTAIEVEQRAKLAADIMALEKQIIEIWLNLDFVKINGYLPVKEKLKAPLIANESDFKLLKNSINPNISKLKGKIEAKKLEMPGLKSKDWEKANKQLTDWENKLQILEEQKKRITNNGQEQSTD